MNKLAISVLALLMACVMLFAACENVVTPAESGGESGGLDEESHRAASEAQITGEEWLDMQPEGDYGRYNFKIASPVAEYFIDNTNADSETAATRINAAVVKRNELVEIKYNIEISHIVLKSDQIADKLREAKLADKPYADLIAVNTPTMLSMIDQNVLMNILSLPHMDLSAAYHEKTAPLGVLGSVAYGLYDNLSVVQGSVWATFYNCDLVAETGQDPLEMYLRGDWNIENMLRIGETVAAETMEKRTPDAAADKFSFTSYYNDASLMQLLWQASGARAFGDSFLTDVELAYDFDYANNIISSIGSLINSKSAYPQNTAASKDPTVKAFKNGNIAFYFNKLDFAKDIIDAGINWSLLPMPKITAAQSEYYSPIDTFALAVCVPDLQEDTERTGMILNALCAASKKQIEKGFVDNYVNFYLSDNVSALMLTNILKHKYIDPANLYGAGISQIAAVVNNPIADSLKSTVKFKDKIESEQAAFEKYMKTHFR